MRQITWKTRWAHIGRDGLIHLRKTTDGYDFGQMLWLVGVSSTYTQPYAEAAVPTNEGFCGIQPLSRYTSGTNSGMIHFHTQ